MADVTLPDEIRQQARTALRQAGWSDEQDMDEILDAVLPIITRGLDRAYHEDWCSASGPGCDCRFRMERDQLRQVNANNLEGWAQDRAGLERRYLRAEQERDALQRTLSHLHQPPDEPEHTDLTDVLRWATQAVFFGPGGDPIRVRGDDLTAFTAERDALRAEVERLSDKLKTWGYAELHAERDARRRLVRWLHKWVAVDYETALAHDLPDDLRATLDADLTETPNE